MKFKYVVTDGKRYISDNIKGKLVRRNNAEPALSFLKPSEARFFLQKKRTAAFLKGEKK